jgi:hypothetical protein
LLNWVRYSSEYLPKYLQWQCGIDNLQAELQQSTTALPADLQRYLKRPFDSGET